MDDPLLRAIRLRRKRSVAQEKRLAKKTGGTVSPQSGAGTRRKADVRNKRFLIEAKCRQDPKARSITIREDDLRKIERHAAVEGRIPVLSFELNGRDYVILQEADLGEPWRSS